MIPEAKYIGQKIKQKSTPTIGAEYSKRGAESAEVYTIKWIRLNAQECRLKGMFNTFGLLA